jgi:hypothetical protein
MYLPALQFYPLVVVGTGVAVGAPDFDTVVVFC